MFNLSGLPMVLNFFSSFGFSQVMLDTISSFSFLTHFMEITRGAISLQNIIYFITIILFWLFMNVLVVETKRG